MALLCLLHTCCVLLACSWLKQAVPKSVYPPHMLLFSVMAIPGLVAVSYFSNACGYLLNMLEHILDVLLMHCLPCGSWWVRTLQPASTHVGHPAGGIVCGS